MYFLLLILASLVKIVLTKCDWIRSHILGNELPTSPYIPKENWHVPCVEQSCSGSRRRVELIGQIYVKYLE